MYSPVGLESWEIVAVSGMFAAGVLAVASLFGMALAHLVFREPSTAAQPAAARSPAPVADARPAIASATMPAYAARTPTVVAG